MQNWNLIDDKIIQSILDLNALDDSFIFSGSLSLWYYNLLNRPVGDLDIITSIDQYNNIDFMPDYQKFNKKIIFLENNKVASSFSIEMNDVHIDFFFWKYGGFEWKFKKVKFKNTYINLIDAEEIIKYKRDCIKIRNSVGLFDITKFEKDVHYIDTIQILNR